MTTKDGVMTMRPVEGGLVIAPGQTVALAPGGYHLMLMGLKEPLQQGRPVGVTLEFEKAGKVAVDLDVLGVGAQGPAAPASAGADRPAGSDHMSH
jgi:copper(I)-binding protein